MYAQIFLYRIIPREYLQVYVHIHTYIYMYIYIIIAEGFGECIQYGAHCVHGWATLRAIISSRD